MKLTENNSFILLRKKKRICNIKWNAEKNDVIQYANSTRYGEINLTSGKFTKNSHPSILRNKIIAITLVTSDNSEVIILSVLSSCDIAFFNPKSNWLKVIRGPEDLLEPFSQLTSLKSYDLIHQLQYFAKLHSFRKTNEEKKENTDKTNNECIENTSLLSFKPRIFSSKNLSKIILITNYSKVYLLTNQPDSSETLIEPWKIYEVPTDICMPSEHAKEACFDVSFISKGPTGTSCCVAYCFAVENKLIITSLLLQWNPNLLGKAETPSYEWISKKIELKKIHSEISFLGKRKSIVMKFSVNDSFLCLVVNSLKNYFYIVYYDVNRQLIAVVENIYPRRDQEPNSREQWVHCLAWCTGSNFIIGCLRSGHIFISTRCGPLLKLIWNNSEQVASNGYYINMFPHYNITNGCDAHNDKSELSSRTSNLNTPKFDILTDLSKNSIIVMSGLEICWFSLPTEICSNEGILSFLLKRTHHSNHKLESLLTNHEYDFIHCSNWRLAAKSQLKVVSKNTQKENGTICSLWFPGNVPFSNSMAQSHVQTELETQKTEVYELLQSTWSLLALRNFKKRDRKLLTKASVSETLKLFSSIMRTSSGNDNEEHQASLLLCLRFFHHLVEYTIAVTPCSFKAIKLCIQVLYRLLHLIMKSINQASSERKLICVIILTQTLTSLKSSLMKEIFFSSFKTGEGSDYKFSKIFDCLMRKHWLLLYRNLLSIWREERIRNVSQLNCMLIVALNIIQIQISDFILTQRKTRVTNEFKIFVSGKYFGVVQNLKNEIEERIRSSFCQKRIQKCVFFTFHVLLIEAQWSELIGFVFWFFKKVSTPENFIAKKKICSKKKFISLKKLFIKLCGYLGIIMAKFILKISVHILYTFEYFDYTSVFDKPNESNKILNSEKYFKKEFCSPLNAIRCLIVGGKYEAVFHLASKNEDFNLCIFSLLTMEHKSSINVLTINDFLINTISTRLKNMVNNSAVEESSQMQLYSITEQLFHLGVLEGLELLLPECLNICLKQMMNLIEELPLVVPFKFYLPSAPLFCPQMDSHSYSDVQFDDEEAKREFLTRQKLFSWINNFCLLCSSSGVDGVFVKLLTEEGLKSSYKINDISNICASLIHEKEYPVLKNDNQLLELKRIWFSFLDIICSLHARDKVSVLLRTLNQSKANMQKYKSIQQMNDQVMKELSSIFFFNNSWNQDAFSLIVATALDASYTVETVNILAKAVSYQPQIPSLIKDKFEKILEVWKTIEIPPNIEKYSHSQDGENLFDLYQKKLKLQLKNAKKDNQNYFSLFSLSNEYIDMICLLLSTAFLKRQFEFSEFERPFPYLYQFSQQIKNKELEGLNSSDLLSSFIEIQKVKLFNESKSENTFFKSNIDLTEQRKGLFRNQNKYCSESNTDIARIYYNNKNTRHSKSDWRSKSFSKTERKTPKSTALKRSKSLNNLKQENVTYKTVLPFKYSGSDIRSTKSVNQLISDMYFSFLNTSYDNISFSSRLFNLVIWILRNDRMSNKHFVSREMRNLKSPNRLQSIFSVNDLKQAIIWDCFTLKYNDDKNAFERKISKNNSRSKNKTTESITKDIAQQPKKQVVRNDLTTNNNMQYDDKMMTEEDIHPNDSNHNHNSTETSVNNCPAYPNSKSSKQNLPNSCNAIDANKPENSDSNKLNIKPNQWQPFIVKRKLSCAPNHSESKSEVISLPAEKECKYSSGSGSISGKNVLSPGQENGYSTASNKFGSSSSTLYGTSINDAIDNTLDDITLSNVLSESDLNKNSSHDCKISSEKCASFEQIRPPKTFIERNNLTFLKNPLLIDNKPIDNDYSRNLNFLNLQHESVQPKSKLFEPTLLDLSQFFNKPSKVSTNKEPVWTLRRLPIDLLEKRNSSVVAKVPSTLLRITSDLESKVLQPTVKEICIPTRTIKKKPSRSDFQHFQLLKIPKQKRINDKRHENVLKLSKMKHTLTRPFPYEHDFRMPSDKFTQTHCEPNQNLPTVDGFSNTTKPEINITSHNEALGSSAKVTNNVKPKEKTIKSKSIQTNTAESKLKIVESKNIQTDLEGNKIKLTEMYTQTENLIVASVPKISTEPPNTIINDSNKDSKKKEMKIENRKVPSIKGISFKAKEISTQTTNCEEISSFRISVQTQTSIERKRGFDKETSTSFQEPYKSNHDGKFEWKENSEDVYQKSKTNSISAKSSIADDVSYDIRNIDENSLKVELKKKFNNHETSSDILIKPFEEKLESLPKYSDEVDYDNIAPQRLESKTVKGSKSDGDRVKMTYDLDLDMNIYKENDNISKNVSTENSKSENLYDDYEKESESFLSETSLSHTDIQPRPETMQDIIGLFMSGKIQVDEICDLVSNYPEYLNMINDPNKNSSENPKNMLANAAKDVNQVKKEISRTRTLLDKVDLISKKCIREDLNLIKYFSGILEPRRSPTKIQFPSQPSPVRMLEFLQQVSPKDLTQNEISQILKHVERETNISGQPHFPSGKLIDPISFSSTVTKNEFLHSEVTENSHFKSSKQLYDESNTRSEATDYSHQSLDLNLNLPKFGLGAYSPVVTFTPSDSASVKEQRKKEIRSFMQRKRREFRENSNKTRIVDDKKVCLTAKEIMLKNKTMEARRERLKEQHSKRRKGDVEIILEDHSREREIIEPILKSKITSPSQNRSFNLKKKLNIGMEDISNREEINLNSNQPKKKQKFDLASRNPLLRTELKSFSNYLASSQHSNRYQKLKQNQSPAFKPIRGTTKSGLNETLTRSLERISEIDSSIASSLSDSSWSLPDDIKRILN